MYCLSVVMCVGARVMRAKPVCWCVGGLQLASSVFLWWNGSFPPSDLRQGLSLNPEFTDLTI